MPASLYIRPIARIPPRAGSEKSGRPPALAVAGRGDLLFAAAEFIERDGHNVRRHVHPASEILTGGPAGLDALPRLVDRLRQPRAPIAGLTLDRPRLMGIVNVTPDSFSDGGQFLGPDAAIAHALQLDTEGADILDIGGESTRPGAEPVGLEEECRRVLPVIAGLAGRTKARLSIDTRKGEVMRRAAAVGVHLINDVSALTHDPDSLQAAAATGLPVVLMHSQGDPRTMQDHPRYADVVLDVYDALAARIEACAQAGIPRERLMVDPGIGFGKTLAHNLALLGSLGILHGLGCTIVLGASRKSFIANLTGSGQGKRLPGSLAAALAGAAQGVQILRVHDVAATRQALAVWEGAFAGGAGPAA